MKIDYKNIKEHFDILATTDGSNKYSLIDKNRVTENKTTETDTEATIVNLKHSKNEDISTHFCEWWRHTDNRETVLQWFKDKYPAA